MRTRAHARATMIFSGMSGESQNTAFLESRSHDDDHHGSDPPREGNTTLRPLDRKS